MISNRLWHLQLSNKIFVINEGKIEQSGSIDELKKVPGFFKDTYERQLRVMASSFTESETHNAETEAVKSA